MPIPIEEVAAMDSLESTIPCRHCKQAFVPPIRRLFPGGFCSKRCFRLCKDYSPNRSEHCCKQCGILFYLFPSQVKEGQGDFCSHACDNLAGRVTYICLYCQKEKHAKKSHVTHGKGAGK